MDVKKVGALIARLRKEKGLTQRELGERLGVSDRAVSKWERGLNLPDAALFEPLCRELGVTIPELLRGEREEAASDPEQAVRDTLSLAEYRERQVRRSGAVIAGLVILLVLLVGLPVLSQLGAGLLWGLGPRLDNWRAQQASPDLPVLPGVELYYPHREEEGWSAGTYVHLEPEGNRGDYFYAPEDGGALREGERPLAVSLPDAGDGLYRLDVSADDPVCFRLIGEDRARGGYEVEVYCWPREDMGQDLTLEDGWWTPIREAGRVWDVNGEEFPGAWSVSLYPDRCYSVVLTWGEGNYVEFPFLTE